VGFLKLSGSVAHEFLAFLCRWRERANGVGSSLPVSELVRHTLEVVKHGAADRFRPDLFWPEAARLPVEQPEEPLAKLPLHDLLRRSIRPRGAICLVREVSVPELLT